MDPTNCLDRILAAYAHDDIDAFREAASDLQGWHDKGGFLPAHLQSMADDLQAEAATLQIATGRRDDDESDDDAGYLDFRIFIRPDATLDLQTGDPCYDTDHRGEIGASSVSPHDTDDDIRQVVIDAFAEAVDSACETFAHCKSWGVRRPV